MGPTPAAQLFQAGWAVLAGAALGALYDLLGGARDRAGLPHWAGDGLFAAVTAGALFVGGLAGAEGRPRLYMALFGLGGMALWLAGASPVTRPLAGKMWARAAQWTGRALAPVGRGMKVLRLRREKTLFKWPEMVYNNSCKLETNPPGTESSRAP